MGGKRKNAQPCHLPQGALSLAEPGRGWGEGAGIQAHKRQNKQLLIKLLIQSRANMKREAKSLRVKESFQKLS